MSVGTCRQKLVIHSEIWLQWVIFVQFLSFPHYRCGRYLPCGERTRVCEGDVSEREKNIIFFPMRIYVWKGWNVGYSLWSLLWESVRGRDCETVIGSWSEIERYV